MVSWCFGVPGHPDGFSFVLGFRNIVMKWFNNNHIYKFKSDLTIDLRLEIVLIVLYMKIRMFQEEYLSCLTIIWLLKMFSDSCTWRFGWFDSNVILVEYSFYYYCRLLNTDERCANLLKPLKWRHMYVMTTQIIGHSIVISTDCSG